MSAYKAIKKRVRDRARNALLRVGQWPRGKAQVHEGAIAAYLLPLAPRDMSGYEIDHKLPLAAFRLEDARERAAVFAPGNHVWLSKAANRSKHAAHEEYEVVQYLATFGVYR